MLDLSGKPPVAAQPEKPTPPIRLAGPVPKILPASLVIVVGVATAAAFFLERATSQELAQLDALHSQLTGELASGPLGETAARVDKLSKALTLLKAGDDSNTLGPALLAEIQKTTTAGINLESFTLTDAGAINIEGVATNYQVLATYLATLASSSLLAEVTLISSSLKDAASGAETSFALQTKLTSAKQISQPAEEGA